METFSVHVNFWNFLLLVGCVVCNDVVTTCTLNLNDLPKFPLIFEDTRNLSLLYPNKYNTIDILNSKPFFLSCPNIKLTTYENAYLDVKCIENDNVAFFNYTEKTKIDQLECMNPPTATIKRSGTCFDNNHLYEIGYQVGNKFLHIFSICYDSNSETSIYSYYNSSKIYLGHQEKVRRKSFAKTKLLSYAVEGKYQITCEDLIEKFFHDSENYMNDKSFYDVVPCQLTPKDNFVFGAEQLSTFVDINSVPIWRIVKETSWNKLESKIREMLVNSEGEYGIATGVYGALRFKRERTRPRVYLSRNFKAFVPKFLWKIIYNSKLKSGFVIVVLNDPFAKAVKKNDMICTNVCDEIDWIKSEDERINQFLYCCDMNEFLEITGFDNMFE